MSDSRDQSLGKPLTGWRLRIYTIIFEADTRAGRLFDQWLIAVILSSVLLVVVDSVQHLSGAWSRAFLFLEWLFTLAFTLEYVARLVCVRHPMRNALRSSRRKIMVFISAVMMIVLVMGTLMYVVEGPDNGYSSIPASVYWAITTITTVGYGDVTPKTDLGRLIASLMMLLGWGTLAVPTGIVTAEMTSQRRHEVPTTRTCHECLTEGHSAEANFCLHCGA